MGTRTIEIFIRIKNHRITINVNLLTNTTRINDSTINSTLKHLFVSLILFVRSCTETSLNSVNRVHKNNSHTTVYKEIGFNLAYNENIKFLDIFQCLNFKPRGSFVRWSPRISLRRVEWREGWREGVVGSSDKSAASKL